MQSKQWLLDTVVESKRGLKIKKATIVLSEEYDFMSACFFDDISKDFYIESNPMFDMRRLFHVLKGAGVEEIVLSINTKQVIHALFVIKALVFNAIPKRLRIAFQGYITNDMLHELANKVAVSKDIVSLYVTFNCIKKFIDTSIISGAIVHNENIIEASYPGMGSALSKILSHRASAAKLKVMSEEFAHYSQNPSMHSIMMKPCPLLDSFQLNFGCTLYGSYISSKISGVKKSVNNSSVSDLFDKGVLEYRANSSSSAIMQPYNQSNYSPQVLHLVYYPVPMYWQGYYTVMPSADCCRYI